MSFFRSNSGIANQAIFSGAKFIVYLEEEPSLDPGRSIDKAFWFEFFNKILKGAAFELKGLGGKDNVIRMADRITAYNIPNSLCALDRDYDDLLGRMYKDPRVFYTFGYGAENDLFSKPAARVLVSATLPGTGRREQQGDELWGHIEATVAKESHCLRSDQFAACRGSATLNRANPTSVIDLQSRTNLPLRFRRTQVRDAIRLAKQQATQVEPIIPVSTGCSRVPAHLHFEIFYHSFVRYLRSRSDVKYNKESVKNIVISATIGNFLNIISPDARRHYQNMSRRKLDRYSSIVATATGT
jgi:Protein of unknown function (DUF4435)